MKPLLAFLALFLLLSFVSPSDAIKEPEDYWKEIMKDQPIPEAIKNLFVQDPATQSDAKRRNHLVKDFDTRSNAIIYHSHGRVDKKKGDNPFIEHIKPVRDQRETKYGH